MAGNRVQLTIERTLLAGRGSRRSVFASQRSYRKKLMSAGHAAQRREPEDSPKDRSHARHMRGRNVLQFEVAANPAMSIEERAKRHQAGVKSQPAGFAAPRHDSRETKEIVRHRPPLGTPAVRTV